MEVQSPIKHHIAGAKHNNLSHTRQLCPHVGPMKAMLFGLVWVRPATLPHLYKTLGFFLGPFATFIKHFVYVPKVGAK
jgi:hypothetical protein